MWLPSAPRVTVFPLSILEVVKCLVESREPTLRCAVAVGWNYLQRGTLRREMAKEKVRAGPLKDRRTHQEVGIRCQRAAS